VQALLHALKDTDEYVRFAAVRALGSAGQGSAEVVQALLLALKDTDEDVYAAAWESLWNLVQQPPK